MDTRMYSLDDPLSTVAFRGDTDLDAFRHMRLAKRGEQISEKSVVIRHSLGRKLLDFIWVSLEPIVHDRVVDLLTLSGATGWSTYPVEVIDQHGRPAPGYHGLSVTGRCESMFLDSEHSETVYVEYPAALAAKYRGLYITRESWDGSDLFTSADGQTDYMIVTEKVRTAFAKAKITNARFKPLSDVEVAATDLPICPLSSAKPSIQ